MFALSYPSAKWPPQRDRKRASAQKRDSWDCSLSPACSEQPYSAEIYPAKTEMTRKRIPQCELGGHQKPRKTVDLNFRTQWNSLDWVLLHHPCMCWLKLAGSPWFGELPDMVLQVTVDAFLLLDPLLVTVVESSLGDLRLWWFLEDWLLDFIMFAQSFEDAYTTLHCTLHLCLQLSPPT